MNNEMKLLSGIKAKEDPRLKKKDQESRKSKKGMTSGGAAFLGIGFIGLFIFGYLLFQSGGLTSLVGMADGIGLIASIILIIAGVYMK